VGEEKKLSGGEGKGREADGADGKEEGGKEGLLGGA